MGNFLNMGTTLLNEGEFIKSGDMGSKAPISIVSTSFPQGFSATQQTSFFGDIFAKDTIDSILSPSIKKDYGINNPWGSTSYYSAPLNIREAISGVSSDPVATSKGSGNNGTVWDTLGTVLNKGLDFGVSMLKAKYNTDQIKSNQVAGYQTGTAYGKASPNALETYYPSKNPFASMVSDWLNPVVQPAIENGIRTGIQGSIAKPPIWIWLALGGLLLVVVLQRG